MEGLNEKKKHIGICNICGIGLAILVAPLFLSSCHHSFSWTLTLRSICHGTPLAGLFHKIPFLIRSWVLRICPLFSTSPSPFDSATKGASFSPDFYVEMIADVVSGGWLDDSWLIVLVFVMSGWSVIDRREQMPEEDLVELKFRLYDGSDIGPIRYSSSSTVAMLKERIISEWPRGRSSRFLFWVFLAPWSASQNPFFGNLVSKKLSVSFYYLVLWSFIQSKTLFLGGSSVCFFVCS